jgi:hypothetical protein
MGAVTTHSDCPAQKAVLGAAYAAQVHVCNCCCQHIAQTRFLHRAASRSVKIQSSFVDLPLMTAALDSVVPVAVADNEPENDQQYGCASPAAWADHLQIRSGALQARLCWVSSKRP